MGGNIELKEDVDRLHAPEVRKYSAFSRNTSLSTTTADPGRENIIFTWHSHRTCYEEGIFLLPATEVIPPPNPQASPSSSQVSTPNVYINAVQLQFTIEWRVPLKIQVFLYRHDDNKPMFSMHDQGVYSSAIFNPIHPAQAARNLPLQLLSEATSPLQVHRLPDGTTAFDSASGNIHDTLPSGKGIIYTDSFSDSLQPVLNNENSLSRFNFGRRTLNFYAPVNETRQFSDGGGRAFDSGHHYVWLALVDVRPPFFSGSRYDIPVACILGGFKCTAHYS